MLKAFVFFLLSCFSYSCWSCSYDASDFTEISKDVLNAKTLVVVKMIGDFSSRKVKSIAPWDDYEISLNNGPCLLPGAPSKLYALYSYLDPKELKNKWEPIDETSARLSDIEHLSSKKLSQLVRVSELPKGHPNFFWGYCEVDKECARAKNKCAVNSKFREKYEEYISTAKDKKLCPNPSQLKSSNSKCIENFCS